ncbi:MAG: shikimate dehydrogenase [Methanosphaera stadtmanae]|nr:shikimate dehydrogenase [Methanosphaera stadtmanae]
MINGTTKLTGVIGNPIEHSLSPVMHNNAFNEMNMDYVYTAFHVMPENLKNVITSCKTLNIKGINVTIPYKTDIIQYLDEIDSTAENITAVNTISFKNGIAKGYNTDGIGAIKSIESHIKLENKNILVLGSGGASKAITFTLTNENIDSLIIANRSKDNAINLINNIKNKTSFENITFQEISNTNEIIDNVDIIINTTPIGMYPNDKVKPAIKTDKINHNHVVMDIIYNPLDTILLKEAKKNGAKIIHGTEMLINQGIESFKIFTDKTPSFESFEKPLLKKLQK